MTGTPLQDDDLHGANDARGARRWCGGCEGWVALVEWDDHRYHGPVDRLFVPLRTEHYRNFERGAKDVELRGYGDRFNDETVVPGRLVELRRGYSTDDSLWGRIEHVWQWRSLEAVAENMDHTRILPDSTEAEFLASARELLGDYSAYIAFEVRIDR